MSDGGRDLWHELSGLADAFTDLGRRMLHASRLLHTPGVVPDGSLAGEIDALRAAFDSARAAVVARAIAAGAMTPDGAPPRDLRALAQLLGAAGDAEERRDAWARQAAPALALLDRILRLEHVQAADFPPLRACQDRARALRDAIARGPAGGAADEVAGLAEGDHPFAYLVLMVEGAERASDDLWESLFEAVGAAFGRPLAAAAGRARLVERAPEGADPPTPAREAPVADAGSDPEADPGLRDASMVEVASAPAPPDVRPALPDGPDTLAPAGAPGAPAAETIPIRPRGLASLLSPRREARPARPRRAPKVEALEPIRLLAACPAVSGFVDPDADDNGLRNPAERSIAGKTILPENATGAVIGPTRTVPAGPGAAVSRAPGWAVRFPRLAASRTAATA